MYETMDHLERLLASDIQFPEGKDRCKIRVISRRRTTPLGDMFDAFFSSRRHDRLANAWYVGAWDGKQWKWCQCTTHYIAVYFAKAVSERARKDASTTGKWEAAKALETVAREWQQAATQVGVDCG